MEGIKTEYMEALRRSNDIEEIQQLMEQLKIIEEENKTNSKGIKNRY